MTGMPLSRRTLAVLGSLGLAGLAAACGEAPTSGADTSVTRTVPELAGPVTSTGAFAPGCVELRGDDGQQIELCGQESLQPAAEDGPVAGLEPVDDGSQVLEIAAASGGRLTASTTGAKVQADVVWTSKYAFELRNVILWDTLCDGKGTSFHTHIPGFQYPDHRNDAGCSANPVSWPVLRGSSSSMIHHLWLSVCRDKLIGDQCADSRSSNNPYYGP